MAIDNELFSVGVAVGGTLLTCGLAMLGYFMQKRDQKIDDIDSDLAKTQEALTAALEKQKTEHSALELKLAEQYATKTTVLALFQQATQENKDAIGRVEKRLDETNTGIGKQGEKLDKLVESLGSFQLNVMKELSSKT